jgi:DNA-binding SARP family transcriptional activator/TolB-like protein/tetratricopeptide (TPR) repeat protein
MRIQLLGRFLIRLADADERLIPVPSRRRRALLAYLAMQPGYSETRERLATLLWGEVPDRQARQSLRQALVAMRADFAPFDVQPLRVERDIVGLDPDLVAVDARELLALADSDRPEDVEKAAAVLQGPFLDGVDLPAEGFTDWLQQQRHRIDAAAATVLGRGAEQADKNGNGPLAIHFAERLSALDPARGSSHRLLLRLSARHRGRDDAMARADSLNKTLREDFDVGLDTETRALIAEIKTGEFEADRAGDLRRVEDTSAIVPADVGNGTAPRNDIPLDVDRPPITEAAAAPSRWKHPAALFFGAGSALIAVVAILSSLVLGWPDITSSRPLNGPTDLGRTDLGASRAQLTPGVSAATAHLSTQGLNPIMVLPFSASGSATEEAGVAETLTNDLINVLSTVTGLRVISRSTSRLYKDKKFDIASIGTELGVRYVVDGSVQMRDGVAVIDVVLTDTSSRLNLWTQRFDRPVTDLPSVISEITRIIARQLQNSVYLAAEERIVPKASGDSTLEDLLSRGWGAMVRLPSDGPAASPASYFEEALKRSPDNSSAQLGYAGSQVVQATMLFGRHAEFDLKRADQYLALVLEQDPHQGTALLYRGMLRRLKGDLAGARDDLLTAVEFHPSFAAGYAQAGYTFYRLGEYDRALEYVQYAMRLSPRDPGLGAWSYMAGMIELERGNNAAAFGWVDRSVNLIPRDIFARLALAAVLVHRGDAEAAHRQVEELARIAPWVTLETVQSRLGLYAPPMETRRRLIDGVEKALAGAG